MTDKILEQNFDPTDTSTFPQIKKGGWKPGPKSGSIKGKGGPGGGISGKPQKKGRGTKRIGSEEEIEQPGEAPPEAKVKKVPKPAKLRLRDLRLKYLRGLKTPVKTPGPDTGRGESPSIAPGPKADKGKKPGPGLEPRTSGDAESGEAEPDGDGTSAEMNPELKDLFNKLNNYIGIADITGRKSGNISVSEADKNQAKKLASEWLKKQNKKEKTNLGPNLKADLLESISFVQLPSNLFFYEVGYAPGGAGYDVSNSTSFALSLIQEEPSHIQGLIKSVYFLDSWKTGPDNYSPKDKALHKKFYNIIREALSKRDNLIADYFKNINYSASGLWRKLLVSYEDTLDEVIPKASTILSAKQADSEEEREKIVTLPTRQQESKTMNQDDIKKLIKEAFTDKVYGQYPYSHRPGDEEEPKEDYMGEWKSFCSQMSQDKSKEMAIQLAKILIKDTDLLQDALELIGQNQSIGSAILKKMENSKKDMV
jgi:hypothetical protein